MTEGHLSGTWFVVPTAFRDDGALDLEAQRRLVERAIAWGVDGLTAMGVMSEAPALTEEERANALTAVSEAAAGRVRVVVGCSAGSAEVAAERARRANELGAAAAMVAAPPLFRDVASLPRFFARVAREGGLPLVLQDEPAATGVTMPVDVLVESARAAGARTIKLEDPPTPPKIAALLATEPGLAVFGGLGGVSALGELRRGAVGTMTGFAFPEILREVRVAWERGEPARAAAVFDRYLPLIQLEGQPVVGLAIRKELLRRRGALATARSRRGPSLDDATREEIDDVLARVGIVPGPEPFEPA